jgi:hypothetical protein
MNPLQIGPIGVACPESGRTAPCGAAWWTPPREARAVNGKSSSHVPWLSVPAVSVYHIQVDDHMVLAAEHDLTGPLQDLVRAVVAAAGAILAVRDETVAAHGLGKLAA